MVVCDAFVLLLGVPRSPAAQASQAGQRPGSSGQSPGEGVAETKGVLTKPIKLNTDNKLLNIRMATHNFRNIKQNNGHQFPSICPSQLLTKGVLSCLSRILIVCSFLGHTSSLRDDVVHVYCHADLLRKTL